MRLLLPSFHLRLLRRCAVAGLVLDKRRVFYARHMALDAATVASAIQAEETAYITNDHDQVLGLCYTAQLQV